MTTTPTPSPTTMIEAAVIADREDTIQSLREMELGMGEVPKVTWRATLTTPIPELDLAAVESLEAQRPDALFIELDSYPENGLELIRYLHDQLPETVIIGLGTNPKAPFLLDALHAGMQEFLNLPAQPEALQTILGRAFNPASSSVDQKAHNGEIGVVFPVKRGQGATTLCVNLAIELHRRTHEKVLLVDLDMDMGQVAFMLGIQPSFSVVDAARNFHRLDMDLLSTYITEHESGIDILSAPQELGADENGIGLRVRHILRFLTQYYDHILVDSSGDLRSTTRAAIGIADHLYLITTGDLLALHNASRFLPVLKGLTHKPFHDWVRLIIGRYGCQGELPLEQVEEVLGLEPFGTIRNDYNTVTQALKAGQLAIDQKRARYTKDIYKMAQNILANPAPTAKKQWQGESPGSLKGVLVDGSKSSL